MVGALSGVPPPPRKNEQPPRLAAAAMQHSVLARRTARLLGQGGAVVELGHPRSAPAPRSRPGAASAASARRPPSPAMRPVARRATPPVAAAAWRCAGPASRCGCRTRRRPSAPRAGRGRGRPRVRRTARARGRSRQATSSPQRRCGSCWARSPGQRAAGQAQALAPGRATGSLPTHPSVARARSTRQQVALPRVREVQPGRRATRRRRARPPARRGAGAGPRAAVSTRESTFGSRSSCALRRLAACRRTRRGSRTTAAGCAQELQVAVVLERLLELVARQQRCELAGVRHRRQPRAGSRTAHVAARIAVEQRVEQLARADRGDRRVEL